MDASSVGIALPLTASVPSSADLLAELLEEVEVADRAGLGFVFIPEHRQGPDVTLGSPLAVASAACARTQRIRVATGVLLAAVHHPVHLAEQVTTLDHLSRGRFILGVGAGYQEADLAPFGVEPSRRVSHLEDVLTSLDLLLREPATAYDGPTVSFPEVRLRPQPLTTPRPPMWLGAWSTPGITRAARLTEGWIADPIRSDGEVAEMAAKYRDACTEHGRPGVVTVMREAWIDTDDERAAERFAPVIEPIYRYYRRQGAYTEGPEDGSGVRFADLADRLVVGSPETCARRVREVAAKTGADHVVLHLRHPAGPDHEQVKTGIEALATALASTPLEEDA